HSRPTSEQQRRLWLSILGLAILFGIAFIWQLGSIGLVDETEPLFAEAARQMQATGDWVTPYFNGETRFDKPPLIYWLMALAYQVLGVNEWSARLPSALSALALVSLSFYTLHRFGCPSLPSRGTNLKGRNPTCPAWMSTAMIILTPELILWGRQGVSDMLLTACMGMALLAFFIGYACQGKQQRHWYLAFFILDALAVLAKGPVGVVLPSLIILSFLLYLGQLRSVMRELPLLLGSGLFLLLTVPWYVLVIRANGQAYLESFFGYHNLERFTSVVNDHAAPWYFYFAVVLLGFAPWSVWLPWGIARLQAWQPLCWRQQPRTAQLGLFALHWFFGVLIFFTIAVTKLPSYVLPLMPAAAILVGGLGDLMSGPVRRRWSMILSVVAHLLLMFALSVACFYSSSWLGNDQSMPNFPRLVQESNVMVWGGLIWGGGAIASLFLLWKNLRGLWWINIVAMVLFISITFLPALQIMDSQRQLPLRQIAETIKREHRPGELTIQAGFKPSLVFYTQMPISYLYKVRQIKAKLQLAWKQADASVLLVGYPQRIESLELNPQRLEVLQEAGAYQLVRVQKD
ncbi:MAG: glycosyltransferase family 39 protein, partial [Cyanobacteria bacterium P01_A01_bin.17]